MSIQRRSFFALKCQSDYWAEIPAIPQFSLCGGTPFTLGAMFWYPHADDDNIIFKQEGAFILGVKGGSVYFEARDMGRFFTDASREPKLLEDEWNTVVIVYDGTKLHIYIQGLKVQESPAAGTGYIDQTTRCQLGIMDGYLQEIVLYSKVLTEEEVLHLQFTHGVAKEQTELWADFDAFSPTDKGRHALPLQLKGRCKAVNLVYGFTPGYGGFALPYGTGQINPGGFTSGELTLLVSVFPTDLSPEDRTPVNGVLSQDLNTVIFSNGERGGEQALSLGVEEETGIPFFILGQTKFSFTKRLGNYMWHQISATVKGTQVELFVDGELSGNGTMSVPFIRTEPPALMIGNQVDNGQMICGFRGCIDFIAVFDKALPSEKLKAYAEVSPYRFEEHLAALWLFSEQYPAELISGANLTYSSGAVGDALNENTVLEREAPVLSFYMPDLATGMDEVETWENRVAAEAILQGMKALTGMEPSGGFSDPENERLNGSMAALVASGTSGSPQLDELHNSGKIAAEGLRVIFLAAPLGGFLGAVCYGFYCSAQNGGLRRAMFGRRFMRYFKQSWAVLKWPVIESGLVGGAATTVEYLKKTPAPDPGTCTSKNYEVTFKSLTFYHAGSKDAGALFGLPGFGAAAVLPEWKSNAGAAVSAPVLYHRDVPAGKTPSVVLNFHCDKKCEAAVKLTFAAACMDGDGIDDVLGAPASTAITIASTGDYSVTLPLPNHKLKTAALAAHKIRWQWRVASPGVGEKLIGKTDHVIHILAAKPLSPWTTEPGSRYPPVYPVISLCHQIAGLESTATDLDRKFAGQFVSWSHNSGKLKALPWTEKPGYAVWGADEQRILAFDLNACITALKSGKIRVSALDCACLQFIFTRLEGLEKLRLLQLGSMTEGGKLCLRAVRRLTAAEDDLKVTTAVYYVCGIPGENAPPDIWDGFLTLKAADSGTVIASGLPFSEPNPDTDMIPGPNNSRYRALLCESGSTCAVTMTVSWLLMEALPKQTIQPGDPVLESAPGRPEFDKAVLAAIELPPYQVRCHCISYKSIERAVVEMVNALQKQTVTPQGFLEALQALWMAVTLNKQLEPKEGDVFEAVALEKIQLLASLEAFDDKETIAKEANLMMSALNNIQSNLRVGMSDWNGSVQDNFDPSRWAYIVVPFALAWMEKKKPMLIATNANRNIFEELPDRTYEGAEVAMTGFYLSDPGDVARIKALRPHWGKPGFLELFKLAFAPVPAESDAPGLALSDRRSCVLFSSANQWNLREMPYVASQRRQPLLVYYLDDRGSGPQWHGCYL